uniref:CID domain-containing protein n=1 Tax=Phytophthora ramorum TaxID=164328 RepID=H3GUC2_PHYRM
ADKQAQIKALLAQFDAQINSMMDYPAKDTINALTMLAERAQFAPEIVSFLETKIHRVAPNCKLPIFYLTDSILKNVRGPYVSLFAAKIVPLYCNCVRQVSGKDLKRFTHVLNTWETTRLFNKDAIAQMRTAANRAMQQADPSARSAPASFNQEKSTQQSRAPSANSSAKLAQQQQDMELRSLLTKLQNDMGIHPTEHMSLEEVRTNNPDYYNQLLEFHAASKVEQAGAARGPGAASAPPPRARQQPVSQQVPVARDPRRPSPPPHDPRAGAGRLLKRKQQTPSPPQQPVQEITNDPPRAPDAAAVMSILQKLKGMANGGTQSGTTTPQTQPQQPQQPQQRSDQQQQQAPPRNDNASRMWFSDKVVAHKDRVESNVQKLYAALPLVCRESGLRFREQAQLDAHLDFLFQYNRARKERGKGGVSRSWYPDEDQWVADFSGDTAPRESTSSSFFDRTQKENEKNAGEQASWENSRVPVDETITRCRICGENFSKSWDEEEEDWMYTNAVAGTIHNTGPNGNEPQDTIFHKYCYETVMANSKQVTPAQLIPAERDVAMKGPNSNDSINGGSSGVKRSLEEDDSDSDGDDDVKRVKTD